MRSDAVKSGVVRAPHRSLLRAAGVKSEDFRKPFIGVCNSFAEVVPGHAHLNKVAESAEDPGYCLRSETSGQSAGLQAVEPLCRRDRSEDAIAEFGLAGEGFNPRGGRGVGLQKRGADRAGRLPQNGLPA